MMLLKLLMLPVTGPVDGLTAVLRVIQNEAEKQLYDPETLRAQLAALQALLEAGDLDEDTYDVLENDILDRLDAYYEGLNA